LPLLKFQSSYFTPLLHVLYKQKFRELNASKLGFFLSRQTQTPTNVLQFIVLPFVNISGFEQN